MLEGGHKKFDWGGGGHKKFSAPVRGCSTFQKITNFYAKIAWFGDFRETKFGRREPAKFFFGRSDFQKKKFLKKNSSSVKKSKIRRGGQKALLEGVGSIWTLGGVVKNRTGGGLHPLTPPCSPMNVRRDRKSHSTKYNFIHVCIFLAMWQKYFADTL